MYSTMLMTAIFSTCCSMLTGCGGASAGAEDVAVPAVVAAVAPSGFWERWGDGRAEIDTYSLVTPRYGELRQGSAVLVFVTEDFTDKQRVKSNGGHDDEYPVLKLNEIRHFQTGIYDYELMTSTFLPLDGRSAVGQPTKVSFSAQEWCGHAYEQLVPRGKKLQHTGHSYFDGEADHDRSLPLTNDGVFADVLPILARGLAGQWPAPGTSLEAPLFDSLMRSRFVHTPPAWGTATLERGDRATTVTVPAGTFSVTEFVVTTPAVVSTWQIEQEEPHRIIRFSTSEGEVGELVASERLPYWQMNKQGDEQHLSSIGLSSSTGLAPNTDTP